MIATQVEGAGGHRSLHTGEVVGGGRGGWEVFEVTQRIWVLFGRLSASPWPDWVVACIWPGPGVRFHVIGVNYGYNN